MKLQTTHSIESTISTCSNNITCLRQQCCEAIANSEEINQKHKNMIREIEF